LNYAGIVRGAWLACKENKDNQKHTGILPSRNEHGIDKSNFIKLINDAWDSCTILNLLPQHSHCLPVDQQFNLFEKLDKSAAQNKEKKSRRNPRTRKNILHRYITFESNRQPAPPQS
jgi:hypothetical protein